MRCSVNKNEGAQPFFVQPIQGNWSIFVYFEMLLPYFCSSSTQKYLKYGREYYSGVFTSFTVHAGGRIHWGSAKHNFLSLGLER